MPWPVPTCKRSWRKGTFYNSGISDRGNQQARVAVAVACLTEFGAHNGGLPSAAIRFQPCLARMCTKPLYKAYQWPVFGIEVHGSAGGFGSPFCNSSIECRSGERTKAMLPSRGGRLMVTPIFISFAQVA